MTEARHHSVKQDDEIEAYFANAKRNEPYQNKSTVLAYVWFFFFGTLMAHRLYLGKWRSALLILIVGHTATVLILLTLLGLPILPHSVLTDGTYRYLFYPGAGLIVGTIIADLFRIPSMVRSYNADAQKRRVAAGLER